MQKSKQNHLSYYLQAQIQSYIFFKFINLHMQIGKSLGELLKLGAKWSCGGPKNQKIKK